MHLAQPLLPGLSHPADKTVCCRRLRPSSQKTFCELREKEQDLVPAFVGLASHTSGHLKQYKHKRYKRKKRAEEIDQMGKL